MSATVVHAFAAEILDGKSPMEAHFNVTKMRYQMFEIRSSSAVS